MKRTVTNTLSYTPFVDFITKVYGETSWFYGAVKACISSDTAFNVCRVKSAELLLVTRNLFIICNFVAYNLYSWTYRPTYNWDKPVDLNRVMVFLSIQPNHYVVVLGIIVHVSLKFLKKTLKTQNVVIFVCLCNWSFLQNIVISIIKDYLPSAQLHIITIEWLSWFDQYILMSLIFACVFIYLNELSTLHKLSFKQVIHFEIVCSKSSVKIDFI